MALTENLLTEDEIKSEISCGKEEETEVDSSKNFSSVSSFQETKEADEEYTLDDEILNDDGTAEVKCDIHKEKNQRNYNRKVYTCRKCRYSTQISGHFRKHMMIHTGEKPYKCSFCQKAFRQKNHLDDHQRKHTGKRPFKCEECGATFVQRSSLNIHRKNAQHIHKRKLALQNKCNFKNEEDENDSKKLSDILNNDDKSDIKGKIKIKNKEKAYICEHCSLKSDSQANLKKHLLIHSGEKPYKCGTCQKAFRQKHHLEDHYRTHTGERPFECEECGSTFVQKSSLNLHKKKHSGVKPFSCRICDHSTYEKINLVIHMRTHTGEKPYQCEKCGVSFSSSSRLKFHTMIHTGERRYKCEECGVRFREKVTLQKHRGTHINKGPFVCDVCGCQFGRLASLALHRKVHANKDVFLYRVNKQPVEAVNQLSSDRENVLTTGKQKNVEDSVQLSVPNKTVSPLEDVNVNTSVSADNKMKENEKDTEVQNNLLESSANSVRISDGECFDPDSSSSQNKTEKRKENSVASPTKVKMQIQFRETKEKNYVRENGAGEDKSLMVNQTELRQADNGEHPGNGNLEKISENNRQQELLKQNLAESLSESVHSDIEPDYVRAALESGTVMESQDGAGKEFYIVLPPCLRNKGVSVVSSSTAGSFIPILVDPNNQSVSLTEEEAIIESNTGDNITQNQETHTVEPAMDQQVQDNICDGGDIVVEGELADKELDGCSVEVGELHIDDSNSATSHIHSIEVKQNLTHIVHKYPSVQEEIFAEEPDLQLWNHDDENEMAVTYVIEEGNEDPIQIDPYSIDGGFSDHLRTSYPQEIMHTISNTDRVEEIKPKRKRKPKVNIGTNKLPKDNSGRKSTTRKLDSNASNTEVERKAVKTRKRKQKDGSAKVKEKKVRIVKDYVCDQCGKACRTSSNYIAHMRTHSGERPYCCDICGNTFKQISHLRSHVRTHTGEKPYVCNVCNAAFTQSSRLNSHKRNKHSDSQGEVKKKVRPVIESKVRNFYCKICRKTFINECFKTEHMRTHKSDSFKCNLCGVCYKSKSRYVKHSLSHCDHKIVCEMCGCTFLDHSSLQKHKMTEHEVKIESDLLEMCINVKIGEGKDFIVLNPSIKHIDQKDNDTGGNIQSKVETDSTVLCDKSEELLQRNGKPETEEEDVPGQTQVNEDSGAHNNNCAKAESEDQSIFIVDQETEELTVADTCSSYIDDKGKKMFVCKVCEKSFSYLSSLKSHVRTHTGERPYQCNVCSKTFLQSSNLKTHMRKHTGERPFRCNYCPQAFKQINHLKDHMYRHSAKKPFTCGECGWCFSQRTAIIRHINKVHNGKAEIIKNTDCFVTIENKVDSDLQSNKVKKQKRKYSKRPKLEKHKKTEVCKVCKKVYSANYLKIHERCHSGERPYKCSTCGEAFKQKSHLQYHEFRHTGEKRYSCPKCEVSYIQSHSYRNHLKRCTGIKSEANVDTSEDQKLECVCGRSFRNRKMFVKHEETCNVVIDSDSTDSRDSQDDYVEDNKSDDNISVGDSDSPSEHCSTSQENIKKVISDTSKFISGNKKGITLKTQESRNTQTSTKTNSSSHRSKNEFTCDCCGISFQDSNMYNLHLKDERRLLQQCCEVCGATFKRASALKFHLRMKHSMTFDN